MHNTNTSSEGQTDIHSDKLFMAEWPVLQDWSIRLKFHKIKQIMHTALRQLFYRTE